MLVFTTVFVLVFPETKSRETSGLEWTIYLDFPLNNHIAKTNKQTKTAQLQRRQTPRSDMQITAEIM